MKFNKWTVGLAAAGIVTVPSLAQADQPVFVQTAVANTTLSGYVDTSAQWNVGVQHGNNALFPRYAYGGAAKADGFNLDVVDVALDKPQDETPWASGYHVELWAGPDANTLGTGYGIRQAYVMLRTPVGNGIDWKIGVQDSPLGYESTTSYNNPNYTRSYGYTIEPTELTGITGTYKFCDAVSLTAGVVDTYDAAINERDQLGTKEDTKGYLADATLTAPKSWGWLADSSLSVGFVHGYSTTANGNGNVSELYVGATLSTPVTGLKAGAALDYRHDHDAFGADGDTWVFGLYTTYQATEKLSFNARGEYVNGQDYIFSNNNNDNIYELTLTAQYDLWKNVVSRVEFRWDHDDHNINGYYYGQKNAELLAWNVIYKF